MPKKMYDVVVAGAGPVGLSLALRLARAKKSVLVIEQNATTHEHSRAPAIWPKTQEILEDLGVIDAFEERGICMKDMRMWDADANRSILKIPIQELRGKTEYPHLLIVPQSRTEKLLYDALRIQKTATVEFSAELQEFEQQDASVRVCYTQAGKEVEVHAKYLIGCDGAHSTVRELLGVHLEGKTYPFTAALADIDIDTDLHSPAISTNGVLVVGIRIDEHRWRLILPFVGKEKLSMEKRVQRAAVQLFGEEPYRDIWHSEFRLHNRISSAFVCGRVALAGDAAHLNSPVGGQGMNAGIQDTEILGEALIHALRAHDLSKLAVYAKHRARTLRRGVNRFTNIMTSILFCRGGRYVKTVLRIWNVLLKIPCIRKRFLLRASMLRR